MKLKSRDGATGQRYTGGRRGGEGGTRARRRHPRVQRQAGAPQRGSGRDGDRDETRHHGAAADRANRSGAHGQHHDRRARSRGGEGRLPGTTPGHSASRSRNQQREATRGFGILMQDVTAPLQRRLRLDDTKGALITEVEPEGPAYAEGWRRRRHRPRWRVSRLQSSEEASRELTRVPSGGTALLRVIHNGRERFVTITKQ